MFSSLLILTLAVAPTAADGANPLAIEFFEKRIRPVLVDNCYLCHSTKAGKRKGGLSLDARAGMLQGGDNGPVIVPGFPDKSRLMAAVKYQNVDLQMPPKGKLADAMVADIEAWIKAGAVWAGGPPAGGDYADAFDLTNRKKAHWCWRPVQPPAVPAVKDTSWPCGPVDRFVLAKLESVGLKASPPADLRTLARRLAFDLTGLPPQLEDVDALCKCEKPHAAIADYVDRLLASPRFGERWARHWLDVVRYAETRGHEFDYPAPNAWQYRDYVIRALNFDVPYDQFLREHVAGDLLSKPRRHPIRGFNESILATGFWWLGEQVHSPVDLQQDEADRIDNQIDVFGKAFFGLTIACARCHDHKFDAISTKDYYALSALLASSSYRQVRFETELQHRQVAQVLANQRAKAWPDLRQAMAAELRSRVTELVQLEPAPKPCDNCTTVIDYATLKPEDWRTDGVAIRRMNVGEVRQISGRRLDVITEASAAADPAWAGLAVHTESQPDPGDLGQTVRAGRTVRTPTFILNGQKLFYRIRGQGVAYAGVQSHLMMEGPLHRKLVQKLDAGPAFRWVEHDVSRYRGDRAHVEITAGSPDFAIAQVVLSDRMPEDVPPVAMAAESVSAAVDRFATGTIEKTEDAAAINALLHRLNTEQVDRINKVAAPIFATEQRLVQAVSENSHLAAAMFDGSAVAGRISIRGNPKAPGEAVPRRLPEALVGAGGLSDVSSGRLVIAEQLADPANPLVARVIVNRIWHHLFGRGIVGSVDNFGVLGEPPNNPELLDFLADRFVRDGWSLKNLIRELALTSTYQQSSNIRPDAENADRQNNLLHRMNLKRLEGEAIRDALLSLSGRLDEKMFGPPVPIHLTPFMDGRGRPIVSGPADGNGRRSIYLEVRRNFLSPMFVAFDTPTPFSTVGRRSVSNTPAQSLVLLNDPFVCEQVNHWAQHVCESASDPNTRIDLMYRQAFGRPATAEEAASCREFAERQSWDNLAHALVNVKEFIFLY